MSSAVGFTTWSERLVVLASVSAETAVRELADQVEFSVDVFTAAAPMLVHCGAHPPSCAMIDCAVRGIDIPSVVVGLREVVSVPSFVAAWEDESSKRRAVRALDAGAVGVISMPASVEDVVRMMRRSGGRGDARLTRVHVGRITAVHESRDVWVGEAKIQMPEVEFGLLWRLMQAFPAAVPLEALLRGDPDTPPCGEDALKHRVLRLRRRLEEASVGGGEAVRFLRGAGYALQEV